MSGLRKAASDFESHLAAYTGVGTPEFQLEILEIHAERGRKMLGHLLGLLKAGKVRRSLLSFELVLKAAADMAQSYGDKAMAAKLRAIAEEARGIDITQGIKEEFRDRPQE